jgi:hypothetical protein
LQGSLERRFIPDLCITFAWCDIRSDGEASKGKRVVLATAAMGGLCCVYFLLSFFDSNIDTSYGIGALLFGGGIAIIVQNLMASRAEDMSRRLNQPMFFCFICSVFNIFILLMTLSGCKNGKREVTVDGETDNGTATKTTEEVDCSAGALGASIACVAIICGLTVLIPKLMRGLSVELNMPGTEDAGNTPVGTEAVQMSVI